jgi:hypothetical protein
MQEGFTEVKYPVALQLVIDVMNDAEKEMKAEDYYHFLASVRDTAGNRVNAVSKVLNKGKQWWKFWIF